MTPAAGSPYQQEWTRLALYLDARWSHVGRTNPVDAAVWLLEHLRRIEDGGILPAYDSDGALVPSVTQLVAREAQDAAKTAHKTG